LAIINLKLLSKYFLINLKLHVFAFFKCFGHEINVETFIKIFFNSCFGIFLGISFGHKINDVETLFKILFNSCFGFFGNMFWS
jgi:hypothetical protein